MILSIIIPYTEGDSTRMRALAKLMLCVDEQDYADYELIVPEVIFSGEKSFPFECDKHLVLKADPPFNKSWAINVAVRNCKSKHILVLDADIRFENDFFSRVVKFIDNRKFFVAYSTIICEKGRDNIDRREMPAHVVKSAGGAWYVNKDFFWEVGGMNEKYYGYGAEDNDMWQRVKFVQGEVEYMPYTIIHTYHHWHPPDSNFPLNPDRVKLFEDTVKDIGGEIERLKKLKQGRNKPCQANITNQKL
ncbi:MAG: glycosyltransferase family 2 protein [Candidatus Heimdallarchaeaceae archaeon]